MTSVSLLKLTMLRESACLYHMGIAIRKMVILMSVIIQNQYDPMKQKRVMLREESDTVLSHCIYFPGSRITQIQQFINRSTHNVRKQK